ncbi:bacillithiol biosynthesis cysteine-adding enzyme BshC [Salinimicrobium sp. GXAS 041]|uniref:bacillithiol biosynthesis cysteine-adding enzyme BshC n=1 Tax=Salinimicrobium sp. GXAS 041 TaxID=3400806 RepID=UPI003C707278
MPTDCISFSETNYFIPLVCDYLKEKEELKPFYNRFPNLENFKVQLEEKAASYNSEKGEKRTTLVKVLQEQYENLEISEATAQNIQSLGDDKTFTITTGHQLNLFTGPLYFLYKIISTVNLAEQLKKEYPEYHFVPVYWMATEDHDFEEINFFYLHGKKFQWNPSKSSKTGGAVGELPTDGLEEVLKLFSAEIGAGKNAEYLKELFKKAYLEHSNLTDATRYLANELFKDQGLVILDAADRELKKFFIPKMKEELLSKKSHENTILKAEALAGLGYGVQVNPREINLFYMEEGLRERIKERDGKYFVHDTEIEWTQEEILELLEKEPEKFSPNVIMRPLYEEMLLPNLCYIGGGGELAYWFELKDYFEAVNIPFPILLLRNSALIQTQKQDEKRKKLKISNKEIFLKQHELINKKVRQISNIDIDFSPQKEHLVDQFQKMYELAEQTDKSFLGAVRAQEVKQLKGLDNLEKRLLKAQKRKLEDEVTRITDLQNQLFPNQRLQERHHNFSEFYLEYGENFLAELFRELQPLDHNFKIISF